MAYYTGSINSFDELLNALITACTANGWAWTSGILSKGRAFVKPSASASGVTGLRVEGGTGQSGPSLVNPSPQAARLGAPSDSTAFWGAVTWPSQYHIHIGTNPDEVYVVLNTNLSDYYWLAFGVSTVPMLGTGLWMQGSASRGNSASNGIVMSATSGNQSPYYGCPCLFWTNTQYDANYNPAAIQCDANGVWPLFFPVGAASLAPLIGRSELTWNKATVLLPAREYQAVGSNMRRLLIDAAHARIVRIGSLEPGQILALGTDKWRVYPFYRKNLDTPDSYYTNTGTFGMALRYDGP